MEREQAAGAPLPSMEIRSIARGRVFCSDRPGELVCGSQLVRCEPRQAAAWTCNDGACDRPPGARIQNIGWGSYLGAERDGVCALWRSQYRLGRGRCSGGNREVSTAERYEIASKNMRDWI